MPQFRKVLESPRIFKDSEESILELIFDEFQENVILAGKVTISPGGLEAILQNHAFFHYKYNIF